MTLRRLALRIILKWQTWQFERAVPMVRVLKREIAEARRLHKPTRHLERRLRNIVTASMEREARP